MLDPVWLGASARFTSFRPGSKPRPPTIARIAPVLTSTDVSAASMPSVLSGNSLRASSALACRNGSSVVVDTQPAAMQLRVPLLVRLAEDVGTIQQIVAQRLREVGALGRTIGASPHPLGEHERLLLREAFLGGQQFVLLEAIQHLQEPHAAAFGIDDRVVARRRLHHAGQERCFDKRQLGNRLAEVGLGRSLDAVRILTEEHRVQVALEDLLFRLQLLQPNRVRRLEHLVAPIALESGHVVVLHHLHRDRRGPLDRTLGGEVRQRGTEEASDVDPPVHPELLVLDGEERIDHVVGNVVERDRLAVLHFERCDLTTGHVEHVRALGEVGEVREFDRDLPVRVGDPPDARRDRDHAGRDEQSARTDDQRHSKNPAQPRHSAHETTDGVRPVGGSTATGPASRRLSDVFVRVIE